MIAKFTDMILLCGFSASNRIDIGFVERSHRLGLPPRRYLEYIIRPTDCNFELISG